MKQEYTFYPIPKTCPIERGSVALIGSNLQAAPTYLLWKDRQEILIQAPNNPHLEEYMDEPFAGFKWVCRATKVFNDYLEIIQLLLPQLPFGETNKVFLLKDSKTNEYYLKSSPMILSKISCPLWATLIPEGEIEFTVWGLGSDRRGIWKGKEVDIIYAYEPAEMVWLNQAMYGYRAVARLDLTFEVYGHLIGKDGSVIGLVSEAAWGRMIKPSDARLVYDAVAQVQGIGCLYRGCLTNRFMIAGNKVRLIDLSCIGYYSDREALEDLAELWHWHELAQLFQEFETHGPYGNHRDPPWRFRTTYKDLDFIPPLPRCRPDLPLGGIVFFRGFFKDFGVEPWEGYEMLETAEDLEEGPNKSAVIRRRGAGDRLTRQIILRAKGFDVKGDLRLQQTNTATIRRRPHLLSTSRHPYHHRLTNGMPKLSSTDDKYLSKLSTSNDTGGSVTLVSEEYI